MGEIISRRWKFRGTSDLFFFGELSYLVLGGDIYRNNSCVGRISGQGVGGRTVVSRPIISSMPYDIRDDRAPAPVPTSNTTYSGNNALPAASTMQFNRRCLVSKRIGD
jgi:hypothetical protein